MQSERKRVKLCSEDSEVLGNGNDGPPNENNLLKLETSEISVNFKTSQDQNKRPDKKLPDEENPELEDFLENDSEIDTNDPFTLHFETEITEDLVSNIEKKVTECHTVSWPTLKFLRCLTFQIAPETQKKPLNLQSLHIKPQLIGSLVSAQKLCRRVQVSGNQEDSLTEFQLELLSIISQYSDLSFNERSFKNAEEIRLVYCLHALNHIMKTRSRIVHHNAKLFKKADPLAEYRDQGLARPKVLIIVPFKESALRVVNLIIKLLIPDKKGNVFNKKRFKNEFGNSEEIPTSKHNKRPDDFEATFSGNIEDSFRIGLTVTRRSLRLYADFYSSDIIIASPLGLRTIIGAEGEKARDYDFLASIEVLVMDQADVFLMQNWEHVLHILQHLHLQPTEAHNTDFSRVRMWSLNGWAGHYRQTLMFSSVNLPMLNAVYNRNCSNFAGRFSTCNLPIVGSLSQVLVQVPQVFHRFDPATLDSLPDDRFQFFLTKILPQFKDPVMSHTLIYVPSYFDFVRLRNYFKREELSFTQICEYSKDGKVARARDMFFHGQKHFLLFTERFHFYHRYNIKGVKHIVFYELPTYPHFYSEMTNLLHANFQVKKQVSTNSTVAILYSKYEAQQLTAVVGQPRAAQMLTSAKKLHLFVTER